MHSTSHCIVLWLCFWDFTDLFTPALADKLLFVHALWRHGDRTPVRVIPTDQVNTVSSWPNGLGELTVRGMEQSFELGQQMKSRYIDQMKLLDSKYDANTVYIRSTGYNRTLMTAYGMLAGMFPPGQEEIPAGWWGDRRWQPIPVHSRPRMEDPMLYMGVDCPKYYKGYHDSLAASKEIQQTEKDNSDLLHRLSNLTGFTNLTTANLWELWDPLFVMKQYPEDHPWPSYMNESIFETLSEMYHLDGKYLHHDHILAQLRGGMLLKDIIDRMQAVVQNKVDKLKFYGYSAHDMTMNALMEALRVHPGQVSGYASCITMELWQNDAGEHFVQVQYKPNSTAPLASMELTPEGCPSYSCPLTAFHERSKPFLLERKDFESACELGDAGAKSSTQHDKQESESGQLNVPIMALGILCAVLILALIMTAAMLYRAKTSRQYSTSSKELEFVAP